MIVGYNNEKSAMMRGEKEEIDVSYL